MCSFLSLALDEDTSRSDVAHATNTATTAIIILVLQQALLYHFTYSIHSLSNLNPPHQPEWKSDQTRSSFRDIHFKITEMSFVKCMCTCIVFNSNQGVYVTGGLRCVIKHTVTPGFLLEVISVYSDSKWCKWDKWVTTKLSVNCRME